MRGLLLQGGYSECYTHGMSKYLLELSLPHASMMPFPPSLQAAAAVYVSREIYHTGGWTANLEYYTGYTLEQITPCVHELQDLVRESRVSPYQAVQKKWNHSRYFHLSECAEMLAYIDELNCPEDAEPAQQQQQQSVVVVVAAG